jgi:hypothetical protein
MNNQNNRLKKIENNFRNFLGESKLSQLILDLNDIEEMDKKAFCSTALNPGKITTL